MTFFLVLNELINLINTVKNGSNAALKQETSVILIISFVSFLAVIIFEKKRNLIST